MTTDDRLDGMEKRLEVIERTQQQIKNIAIGIAVGLVVAAFIFGLITVKEAKELIK